MFANHEQVLSRCVDSVSVYLHTFIVECRIDIDRSFSLSVALSVMGYILKVIPITLVMSCAGSQTLNIVHNHYDYGYYSWNSIPLHST